MSDDFIDRIFHSNDDDKGIVVLGLNRHKRYEYVYTMKSHIENVRLARTYKPQIMALMPIEFYR